MAATGSDAKALQCVLRTSLGLLSAAGALLGAREAAKAEPRSRGELLGSRERSKTVVYAVEKEPDGTDTALGAPRGRARRRRASRRAQLRALADTECRPLHRLHAAMPATWLPALKSWICTSSPPLR